MSDETKVDLLRYAAAAIIAAEADDSATCASHFPGEPQVGKTYTRAWFFFHAIYTAARTHARSAVNDTMIREAQQSSGLSEAEADELAVSETRAARRERHGG